MNGNNERGIVPVLNSSHSTVKIDSLCIKLNIMKKEDTSKCRHFSIRGYVAGMREAGSSNLLPFGEELPPMEVPKFRYWLCQKCLQTANETTSVSVCDLQCVFPPAQHPLPFGEGTSGLNNPVDSNDQTILAAALGADESQTSQKNAAKVKVSLELTKCSTIDTNAGKIESNELKNHGNPQKTSIVISQPIESGQQNDNGLPRRKARKVRLLKELLCGNTQIQQQKNKNTSPLASQIKRKMLHDHHHHDHDHDHHHNHRKTKAFKEDATAKNSVVEHSRDPGAREFGEDINSYEWNKHATPRNSILGMVNSDAVTAWRSIFRDIGRPGNPPTYSVSKSRGTEPYSNFMSPPKSDKKVNSLKKMTSNPMKSKFCVENSSRMKDKIRSHAELGLDLSLNYEGQSHFQSQPSVLNQPPSQDYNRKSSFFFGQSVNFPHRIPPDARLNETTPHEKRLYSQLPYGSCSGHQKLDFSDPYKRNIGVTRPNNHQRQEKMLSIGRSDEHEVIELMAKNQYERNLCEPNNGMISGLHRLSMNERMTSSHHDYLTMIRPSSSIVTSENMRNPAGSFFHQDQVSSFAMNQKKPLHGVWISDSRSQRHYDSRYHYASNGLNKKAQAHLYNPTNLQVLEALNKYNNAGNQNEAASMQLSQTYAKHSEKDKGKNMMDLDLNLVAPNVVEEHNNLERSDLNPHRMCSFDSSYSNETIPAMQLLSLMDAGKSSQPFSLTSQPFITKPKPKPISISYSHFSSTATEKANPAVNPINGGSFFNVLQTGQNVNLTSCHGQQVYHKPQEKSRCTSLASVRCRPEDSYVFPLPWHASEGQNNLVNRASVPRFESSKTEICTINQNPADFSTPGPENVYMIDVEDLVFKGRCSYKGNFTSENVFGPKSQRIIMKPTI